MEPGRALEAGCASGAFMTRLRDSGWDVDGLEFSAVAAQRAMESGFRVHVGTLESAPDRPEAYDLIVAWMVVEHLHDPVSGLTKLARWTRPRGILALSVPNAGSLEFAVFRDAWYALQLPTHLYHFTPRTLRRLLSSTGWHVDRVLHQRNLGNLIASVGYKLEDWGLRGGLARRLVGFPDHAKAGQYALYPAAAIAAAFGQTGRMTVWAHKV